MPLIPSILNGGVILMGPSADGAPGQSLVTDGAGHLLFATIEGGEPGVPSGGTTGQALVKASNADGDVGWSSLTVSMLTDLTATAAELNRNAGVTAGLAAASKVVVVDANRDVFNLRQVGVDDLRLNGSNLTRVSHNGSNRLDLFGSAGILLQAGGVNHALYGTGLHLGHFAGPTALLQISGDTLRLTTARTPASATAAGNQGDVCWDANYLYVCIATNTWRRIAHATW